MPKLSLIDIKPGVNKTDGRHHKVLTFAVQPEMETLRRIKLDDKGNPVRDANGQRVIETYTALKISGNGKPAKRTVWEDNIWFKQAEVGDTTEGQIVTRQVEPYTIVVDNKEVVAKSYSTVVFDTEDIVTVFASQRRALLVGDVAPSAIDAGMAPAGMPFASAPEAEQPTPSIAEHAG